MYGYDDYPQRTVLEIVLKTLLIHVISIANYVHLQRVINFPQKASRAILIWKIIIYTFMPTLVAAEIIFNVASTIFPVFVRTGTDDLVKAKTILQQWRKSLCGMAGMYARLESREAEEEIEQGEAEQPSEPSEPTESSEAVAESPAADPSPEQVTAVKLVGVLDESDLQHRRLPWNWQTILRIVLLVIAMLQAIGVVTLWIHRTSVLYWNAMSLDKRNFVAATGSLFCSICSIIILSIRREWTLNHLTTSTVRRETYPSLWLGAVVILAGYLNEAPFLHLAYGPWLQHSFVREISYSFDPSTVEVVLVIVAAILCWAFRSEIASRIKIRWAALFAACLLVFCLWIAGDLLSYINDDAFDVAYRLSGATGAKDPWSVYLPIC